MKAYQKINTWTIALFLTLFVVMTGATMTMGYLTWQSNQQVQRLLTVNQEIKQKREQKIDSLIAVINQKNEKVNHYEVANQKITDSVQTLTQKIKEITKTVVDLKNQTYLAHQKARDYEKQRENSQGLIDKVFEFNTILMDSISAINAENILLQNQINDLKNDKTTLSIINDTLHTKSQEMYDITQKMVYQIKIYENTIDEKGWLWKKRNTTLTQIADERVSTKYNLGIQEIHEDIKSIYASS